MFAKKCPNCGVGILEQKREQRHGGRVGTKKVYVTVRHYRCKNCHRAVSTCSNREVFAKMKKD